jgi:hypothetical protein
MIQGIRITSDSLTSTIAVGSPVPNAYPNTDPNHNPNRNTNPKQNPKDKSILLD